MHSKILAVCFFIALNVNAQGEKIIRGTIQDGISLAFIQGAYIFSTKQSINVISNGEGVFSLSITIVRNADSLIIDALGYERQILPLTEFDASLHIKLRPVTYVLPEVTVSSYHINWVEFMGKFGQALKTTKIPFESDLQKTIDVSTNSISHRKINIKAFSHYEGLTMSGLTSYLRGLTFWYAVNESRVGDTTSFIDCNESGKPQVFTDFEMGRFQWLVASDTTGVSSGESIAQYHMEAITVFGGDSVYIVKHTPKPAEINKSVQKLNQFSSNGVYTFFSAEKTYYVRKKDYRLLRIDFYQNSGQLNQSTKKNVRSIDHISGSVGFQYPGSSPHPAYIYQTCVYTDIQGNLMERKDSSYYSNVKMIDISNEELKKKYQISKIYRSYPIRDVQLNIEPNLGAFWYVPMIKK